MKTYHLTLIAAAAIATFNVQAQTAPSGPSSASAGECYAKVVIPARFDIKSERVVSLPASKRIEVVPASYKTISEQILVSPGIQASDFRARHV